LELDSLLLDSVEWPRELARTARSHHLPEQRRLIHVLWSTVDQHDPMLGCQTPPQLPRSDQAADAAAENHDAPGRPGRATTGRPRFGRTLVHLLERGRET
jgi:hypothetical protein